MQLLVRDGGVGEAAGAAAAAAPPTLPPFMPEAQLMRAQTREYKRGEQLWCPIPWAAK